MKKTSVKLWVWSAIILVLGYLVIYDINKHIPLDHHIFYDMFYKERLIEALKKNNVEYLIDNDNKDAIFLHVKDREKVLKIESILNNQYQEYGLSNTDHKNDFLQLLTDNNITYKENIISVSPPVYRIFVDSKFRIKSKELLHEVTNKNGS